MTTVAFLRHSTLCPKCGEDAFAPERSEFVSATEVHHVWCCWHCGDEFETLDHLETAAAAPSELIRKALPSLLVA
jgi:hypothetical protein